MPTGVYIRTYPPHNKGKGLANYVCPDCQKTKSPYSLKCKMCIVRSTPWNKGLHYQPNDCLKKWRENGGNLKGRKCEWQEENKNHFWKGNKVKYSGIHMWIRSKLGKAPECAYCGKENWIDWASISHKAKRDLNDFIPLCRSCHRKYDYDFERSIAYA